MAWAATGSAVADMAFFGLLLIASMAFSVAVLYAAQQLSAPASSVQSQVNAYSAMVSEEAFADAVAASFPAAGDSAAVSNWRASVYASARADRLNITLAGGYALVRGVSAPGIFESVLLPNST